MKAAARRAANAPGPPSGAPAGRRRWVALAFVALLTACAANRPQLAAPGMQALSGRLWVRIAAHEAVAERAIGVAFELRGQPEAGQIEFSTPLGSILARARWSPGEVLLITPEGERAFHDLDSLSREALGEALPLAALFDWLQGRPWPAADSQVDPAGQAFVQLGWRVDLARLAEARITAQRLQPPVVSVRVLLDRP